MEAVLEFVYLGNCLHAKTVALQKSTGGSSRQARQLECSSYCVWASTKTKLAGFLQVRENGKKSRNLNGQGKVRENIFWKSHGK